MQRGYNRNRLGHMKRLRVDETLQNPDSLIPEQEGNLR